MQHIERILRDTGGTKVRLGATEYHFKELWAEGPHVAPVEDEAHRDVFLSVPEGYREYDGPLPETLTLGAIPVLTPPVVAPVQQEPAPVQQEPAPEQSQPTTSPADTGLRDLTAFEGRELTEDEDAALRSIFADEIGSKPHHNAKPETMIARIIAKREEDAGQQKDA